MTQIDASMLDLCAKVRRYSRADVLEAPTPHPPFQHQIRMQIRHLISQQQHKHHKRKLKKLSKSDNNGTAPTTPPNGFLLNISEDTNSDNIKVKNDFFCEYSLTCSQTIK